MIVQTCSEYGERFITLTGNDDRDSDALDELIGDLPITYEFFEPNTVDMYLSVRDARDPAMELIYAPYEYVTLYYSEDDGEWFLWE